jgi:G3E family GTPase
VGKLSDIVRAVERAGLENCQINSLTTVVDANKCKMYMKNFGEFFNDQIQSAACIVFSHVDLATEQKLAQALALVREKNAGATVVTTAWDSLNGKEILSAMEHSDTLATELDRLQNEEDEHEHCHDDDDDEREHEHHHHHDDDDDDECEHEHHHHDHDDDDECEHEHHHHDHDDDEHEHHHHHHHADEVFSSWGVETGKKFTTEEIKNALGQLSNAVQFGTILRAKGIVQAQDGKWIHFDYVPSEIDVRYGTAAYTGRLCVIGSKIDEDELKDLFGV